MHSWSDRTNYILGKSAESYLRTSGCWFASSSSIWSFHLAVWVHLCSWYGTLPGQVVLLLLLKLLWYIVCASWKHTLISFFKHVESDAANRDLLERGVVLSERVSVPDLTFCVYLLLSASFYFFWVCYPAFWILALVFFHLFQSFLDVVSRHGRPDKEKTLKYKKVQLLQRTGFNQSSLCCFF